MILVTARLSDAPAPRSSPGVAAIKIFALQNLPAEEAAADLTKLFKDAAVQIEADSRTNSVLVRGSQEPLAEIEAILLRLDQSAK